MPYKDSGTELASCRSHPVGVATGKVTTRGNHAVQRLESIWQNLPALVSLNYPC